LYPFDQAGIGKNVFRVRQGITVSDMAQAVKDEVAAIFGFGGPAYKELSRIRFTSPR